MSGDFDPKMSALIDGTIRDPEVSPIRTHLKGILKPPRRYTKRVTRKVAARRHEVAEMMKAHMTQRQMSIQLGVSTATISTDVKIIMDQWCNEVLLNVTAVKGRELVELDQMEAQAAKGYRESKSETSKIRWLRTRLMIKARRAKLIGLDSPIIHHHVTAMDKALREMSDEELDRLLEQHMDLIDVTPAADLKQRRTRDDKERDR